MKKKHTAVLDVGSSKITAVIGERGINKTFLIKARKDFFYDGFADREFLSIENVKKTIIDCAHYINSSAHAEIASLYVGVPGAFTDVIVKDSQIAFPKKKRINENDTDALFDSAFVLQKGPKALINRSAIAYEIDGYRRLANPIGEYSEVLKGTLSFITCDNYFIDIFRPVLVASGFPFVEFVSTMLAETMYLLEMETRDKIAMLIDVGYITTTYALVQGDGIIYQSSFDFGGGYITAYLIDQMNISIDEAEELKRKVSLSTSNIGAYDVISCDSGKFYNAEAVRTIIKNCLDVLCEKIEDIIEESGYAIPDYVPIEITGGGISYIRGAVAYISSRLGCYTEVIYPKVPLMEKPIESSVLSLLDLTFE